MSAGFAILVLVGCLTFLWLLWLNCDQEPASIVAARGLDEWSLEPHMQLKCDPIR